MSSELLSNLESEPESDGADDPEYEADGIIRCDWLDGSAFVFSLLEFLLPSPIV